MSSRSWYVFLLNKHVLLEESVGDDGTPQTSKVMCKVEINAPDLDWDMMWSHARMKGLTNDNRAFLWRMLHNILPTQARLFVTSRNVTSPNCIMCEENETDDIKQHSFKSCDHSKEAMTWLINIIIQMDPSTTLEKIVTLHFEPLNCDHLLECIWITALTLEYIWSRRKKKKNIVTRDLISHARANCKMFCKSQFYNKHAENLLTFL